MSYETGVLALSPNVYLRLQELSGSLCADSSGNGLDGTAHGTFTRNTASEAGITPGIHVGGTTADFVDVPDDALLDLTTNFTLVGWFKLDAAFPGGAYFCLFSKGNPSGASTASWVLYITPTGSLQLFKEAVADIAASNAGAFPDDQGWHMVALAFTDATTMNFYVDGVDVGTNLSTAAAFATNTAPFRVGMDNTGGVATWPFKGSYDEPALFPSVLSAGDIAALYASGLASCNPPVNTVAPSIAGSAGVGNTLTLTQGTYTGDATIVITDQWMRDCGGGPTPIVGETGLTYDQTLDDVGCSITVEETATNGCAPDDVETTNSIGPVPTPAPVNLTPPTITGVTPSGHTLEGFDGTWDFATSFDEQWYLDCGGGPVAIVGETTDEIETTDPMIGCTLLFGVIAHGPGGDSSEIFSDPFGPITANVPAAVRFYQSPAWRFVILDRLTFETLSFLDKLETDRSVTYVLNQPAIHVGKVPSDEPEINIPWPAANDEPFMAEGTRTVLGLRREGVTGSEPGPWVPRFHGFLEQLEDVAESDNAFSHLTAYDPLRYLMSRPVRNGADFDYTLPGPDGSSYTETRIDVIIGEIIHNTIVADGPVGIDAGTVYGGTSSWGGTIEECDQIDINFAQGTTVGEAIQQLTSTDQVDILLLPIYDPTDRPGYLVELSIFNQAGAVIDDAIFAWDKPSHSLVGISRLYDGTTRANSVKFFAGQGGTALGGQMIPVSVAAGTRDLASEAKFGSYWYQQFWPGQNVAGAVLLLAQTQLALRKEGKITVAISPAAQRSPIPFQEYGLGDRVPVYASNRFRAPIPPGGVEGIEYQRIYGIPISIADDQTETILEMLTAVTG